MALIACVECGHTISDRALACPKCGHPKGGTQPVPFPVTPPAVVPSQVVNVVGPGGREAAPGETVFLSRGGVIVTNARFVTPGKMYAMSGLTSVQALEEKPSRIGCILFAIVLAFIGMALGSSVGGMMAWAGAICLFLIAISLKSTFHVVLHSASGEVQALSDSDERWIRQVVGALTDAVVHRG